MQKLRYRLVKQLHLSKRQLGLTLRLRTVAPLVFVALGACSQAFGTCYQGAANTLSTRGPSSQLSEGCTAQEANANGVSVVVCADGREGFMVVPSAEL